MAQLQSYMASLGMPCEIRYLQKTSLVAEAARRSMLLKILPNSRSYRRVRRVQFLLVLHCYINVSLSYIVSEIFNVE